MSALLFLPGELAQAQIEAQAQLRPIWGYERARRDDWVQQEARDAGRARLVAAVMIEAQRVWPGGECERSRCDRFKPTIARVRGSAVRRDPHRCAIKGDGQWRSAGGRLWVRQIEDMIAARIKGERQCVARQYLAILRGDDRPA